MCFHCFILKLKGHRYKHFHEHKPRVACCKSPCTECFLKCGRCHSSALYCISSLPPTYVITSVVLTYLAQPPHMGNPIPPITSPVYILFSTCLLIFWTFIVLLFIAFFIKPLKNHSSLAGVIHTWDLVLALLNVKGVEALGYRNLSLLDNIVPIAMIVHD